MILNPDNLGFQILDTRSQKLNACRSSFVSRYCLLGNFRFVFLKVIITFFKIVNIISTEQSSVVYPPASFKSKDRIVYSLHQQVDNALHHVGITFTVIFLPFIFSLFILRTDFKDLGKRYAISYVLTDLE
jgi:hypothetical protein